MIRVNRRGEPARLRVVRARELPALRQRVASGDLGTIVGYECVAEDLWRAQHHKCCYCEIIVHRHYNDVEHFRPKAAADRSPGCTERHGYWWLAYHWENLLFSCPGCNRSGKGVLFPLDHGSVTLPSGRRPPGQEMPLLLDPAADEGVEHIEFIPRRAGPEARTEQWLPIPRQGSRRGEATIRILRLDRQELMDLYINHFNYEVKPVANELLAALRHKESERAVERYERALTLLFPARPLVGLAYDALRHLVSDRMLMRAQLPTWPTPAEATTLLRSRRHARRTVG